MKRSDWVILPSEGRAGEPPTWPLTRASKRELQLWAIEWQRPQAVMWEAASREHEVACYVRTLAVAEKRNATSKIRTLLMQQWVALGISFSGLRRHRWSIGPLPLRSPRECSCGSVFEARSQQHVFCSQACVQQHRLAVLRGRPKNAEWAAGHQPERDGNCIACRSPIRVRTSRAYCQGCRTEVRRDNDARKNARRRGARGRGIYTMTEIGNRDGWRCHICMAPVDPNLSGRDSFGPSRDHVLPLSRGGLDTALNVRLAHLICNIRRGNRPLSVNA